MIWLLAILGAIVMAIVGSVVCVLVLYLILALAGMTEMEGRRGLTAGLYGILFGAPVGAYAGLKIVWYWMI